MPELQETSGRKIVGNDDVLKECGDLEAEIAELKAAWEQYFLGVEKRPPTEKADEVRKRVADLKTYFVRSTAVKFRVQGVAHKYATLDRLWSRTLAEIENGTYRRDLARARRKDLGAGKPVEKKTEAPAEVVPQIAPVKPAPEKFSEVQLSDDKLRAVYNAYVKAKKTCNEDISRISFDQVAQSLRKQIPELMKKHNARSVEFKVVIKDGKATLRAVPREV
jgi:hypothetical protein